MPETLSLAVRLALLDQLVADIEREIGASMSMLLARSAVNWHTARKEAARLRAARAACLCERAEPETDPDIPPVPEPTRQPSACWKWREQKSPDRDPEHVSDIDAWCASCQHRQALHVQYVAAVRRRGLAQGTLTRLAAKATSTGEASA